MPGFYTDPQGRVRPIRGKGTGYVVAGAPALGVAAVSVVWVGLPSGGDARKFHTLMDRHGSGFDHETLDAIAEVAAYLPPV